MVLGFYPDNRLSDDINIGVKTIVLKQSISSENATVGLEPNFERSMLQTHGDKRSK